MAEQIQLQVELKNNLEKTINATKGMKLDKGQSERLERYSKGAQLALESGDLKTFQRNFNNLIKLFKDAAAATGKVSETIKKMTSQQEALNKEINQLKDKKTKLETHHSGGKLTKEGAKAFYNESADAKKVIKSDGTQATRDEIIAIQKAISEVLRETGKQLKQLTNEDMRKVSEKSGIEVSQRTSGLAAERYVKNEKAYEASIPGQIDATNTELQTKEAEYAKLSAELTRMSQAASNGADNISKLYAEISKLGGDTNKIITDEENRKKKEAADQTPAAQGVGGVQGLDKQNSALGKAFKQITLYNLALKAAKKALREAIQTVKELDKYLTEQAMVTGKTRQEAYALLNSYQDLAKQCGATTKEIAQVATEYMKQGKSTAEALTLTEAAVKAAKVAGVSVTDSVNYLTTALNGFQLAADQAMAVSDKFAAIAAASATDYDELAIALSKVASQANLAGMSIDYTTALLTKGLETTREAPETMGTALKTIIARMRELGDYGETLDDGMDLNNVESQLAYVDIALRDANGELRSTEDVLDELGRKWDTLNKNQQAAIAKALAGTRQQARLIAMMEDYDRVIELQEIAQESAGATAAQAGVYLEGMEAAMNKIKVAWEEIVMTVVDSEAIINIFHNIGSLLEWISDLLSTDEGMQTFLVAAVGLATMFLIKKISEYETQKAINREVLKKNKAEKAEQKLQNKKLIAQKKSRLEDLKEIKNQATKNKLLASELKAEAIKSGNAAEIQAATELELEAEAELNAAIAEETQLKQDIRQLKAENNLLTVQEMELSSQIAQNGAGFLSTISSVFTLLTPILSIMSMIFMVQNAIVAAKKREGKEIDKNNAKEAVGLGAKIKGMFANIVKAFSSGGIPGVIAGIVLATALAVGLGFAIAAAVGAFSQKEEDDDPAAEIQKLSAEIYKLNEKANAIDKIADSIDNLDSKLIKTNADMKEMNSLLDQAADKLSDEIGEDEDIGYGVGVSEKAYYESMTTTAQKRAALREIERNNRIKIATKREEIRQKFKSNPDLITGTSAEALQAQSAIYADNNDQLYQHIDKLKESRSLTEEEASAVQDLTQSILENMSASEAWAYAQDGSGKKVQELVNSLRTLTIQAKNTQGELERVNIAQVLTSDDYGLTDQIAAYKEALSQLKEKGDAAAIGAFKTAYAQYDSLLKYEDNLDFFDERGMSIDDINKLYGAWEKLQKADVKNGSGEIISQEVFESRFSWYIDALEKYNGDALKAAEEVFSDYLDGSEKTINAFVKAYGDIVQVGILNMGQNMEKVQNSINGFYEKSLEWNEMSESEKAEFIQDNADLFAGDGGKELLNAFQTGNYSAIEDALKKNENLKKQLDQRRKEVEQELLIERDRKGDDRNEAYIAQLEDYQKYLNDYENMFKASLELRLEQERNQLEEYKALMEKERDALVESLEKRREAYEKYFDTIAENEEDEEYETQSELLVTNIAKLASSGDADSKVKRAELEQQLQELEKERLQTLKERAREAVLENMDSEISEINDKFDDLLESNRALLAAMQGDLEDPTDFLAKMISGKVSEGATELDLEEYVGTLEGIYGNTLTGVDWDSIKEEVVEQLFLNVNGQDITLNEMDERAVYEAVKKALQAIGKR